jgi:hypothetical protein
MADRLFIDMGGLEQLAEEVSKTKRERTISINADVVAVLKPARTPMKRPHRVLKAAGIEAAWRAFGGWKDEDVDAFLRDNAESRSRSIGPSVDL